MTNDKLLQKRFAELYDRAGERHTKEFTDFLNLNEISELKAALPMGCYTLYGGYEGAERCVAGFGKDINEVDFPLCCLKIEPTGLRFAENLTHRDFLGSLLALGITREMLGDILIDGKTAYAFCISTISEYVADSLKSVRRTSVKCSVVEGAPELVTKPPEISERIVPSLRADALISSVYKLSRKETASLFAQDKIFINACKCEKGSKVINEGDIISVRGYGRFIFEGEIRKTKKDRIIIEVRIY